MEAVRQEKGDGGGDEGTDETGGEKAFGDQTAAQSHQGEDQGVKAGNDVRQQTVAHHAQRQGVNGPGQRPLQRAHHGGQHGIEEGNDAPEGDALKDGSLGQEA